MKKQLVACGLVIAAFGSYALAQPPPPPKPGPEHKALGYFTGKWTGEADIKPGPLGPGGKMTSSDSCEWAAGGFHVVCRGEAKGAMGPMTSVGVMSYNAAGKAYNYYGIDSLGSNELSTGSKSGNTWTFTADSHIGGQSFKSRYTIVEVSPTSYTFKWESSADGTKWATIMEGKSSKSGT